MFTSWLPANEYECVALTLEVVDVDKWMLLFFRFPFSAIKSKTYSIFDIGLSSRLLNFMHTQFYCLGVYLENVTPWRKFEHWNSISVWKTCLKSLKLCFLLLYCSLDSRYYYIEFHFFANMTRITSQMPFLSSVAGINIRTWSIRRHIGVNMN